MTIFLPVAGISVNLFVLMGVGALVGFLSGVFGVGGGFLLTPLLIMLGIRPLVAAASDATRLWRRARPVPLHTTRKATWM